jgi:putative oxidoreductase
MAHEARTDFAMILGAIFLLLIGSGPWAFDRTLAKAMVR